MTKSGILAVLITILTFNYSSAANQYQTKYNPFTHQQDYVISTNDLEVGDLTASGTVSGVTVIQSGLPVITTESDPLAWHLSGDQSSLSGTKSGTGISLNMDTGAITGTSFIIGANTLNTSEWANLDGQDQTVKTTSSPQFVTAKLTNLTDGYLPYHSSDSVGLVNSPAYTDGTKVGIGTTAPDYTLDVNASNGNVLQLVYNDSNGASANNVQFQVTATGNLNIKPSGGTVYVTQDVNVSRDVYVNGLTASKVVFTDNNKKLTSVGQGTSSQFVKGDGSMDSTAYASLSGTQSLTNKRIFPRVTTITSSATPTINTNNCDAVTIQALATDITSMTTNLSGTPSNFDSLFIRIKDDGTPRAITWGTSFQAEGVALPTTTVASKVLTVEFIYDVVPSKWGCVRSVQEI